MVTGSRIRPKRFSVRELAKVGVEIRDPSRVVLGCTRCGHGWSPMLMTGGRLPRGYWKCPEGCNE